MIMNKYKFNEMIIMFCRVFLLFFVYIFIDNFMKKILRDVRFFFVLNILLVYIFKRLV